MAIPTGTTTSSRVSPINTHSKLMPIFQIPTIMKNLSALLVLTLLFVACTHHPDVPATSLQSQSLPCIYPDYTDVTIPCNIAPLNFMLPDEEYTACVARFTTPDGRQLTYGDGVKVQIPEDEWHTMLTASVGQRIQVEVWGLQQDQWTAFLPFSFNVSPDSIDSYISYRLIEPTYVAWNYMSISQRDLTTFRENEIFNNSITCDDRAKGQCINCHSYQDYKTDNMLFHVRLSNGCTIIVNDGQISKTNLKRDYTISSGVYPSWHPTQKLIAFSTNLTRQVFHSLNHNKIEVFDLGSDIIMYDVSTDSVHVVSADPDRLEVYPTWSPDGQYLYYCKTTLLPDSIRAQEFDIRVAYPYIQYNLYRRAFDQSTLSFGPEELIYDAAVSDQSLTLPRISPDGQYLLFALGHYGCFHSRHSEADIVCIPLAAYQGEPLTYATCQHLDMSMVNSEGYSESYPTWSSNGHWIMVASRRYDGNYSRCYFAHFDEGHFRKAFLLPQEDPEHNIFRNKSYNRPEFMVEPVTISIEEFSKVINE